jgi:hypothetical protein
MFASALLPAGERERIRVTSASQCPDDATDKEEEGWEKLTDGKTFAGWKANEREESWKVEDGAFVANGDRSHLFYVGPEGYEKLKLFKNFEIKVDVMTRPGSNGGIYFHTRWQDEGWPANGYECQVNVSQRDPVKTGSLYNTEGQLLYEDDIKEIIKDNEWWTQHIIVRGNRVIVKLNDKQVIDYTEPENKRGRVRLSEGTFALQAHDPGSTVYFKNIRVKRLPDDAQGE